MDCDSDQNFNYKTDYSWVSFSMVQNIMTLPRTIQWHQQKINHIEQKKDISYLALGGLWGVCYEDLGKKYRFMMASHAVVSVEINIITHSLIIILPHPLFHMSLI